MCSRNLLQPLLQMLYVFVVKAIFGFIVSQNIHSFPTRRVFAGAHGDEPTSRGFHRVGGFGAFVGGQCTSEQSGGVRAAT